MTDHKLIYLNKNCMLLILLHLKIRCWGSHKLLKFKYGRLAAGHLLKIMFPVSSDELYVMLHKTA